MLKLLKLLNSIFINNPAFFTSLCKTRRKLNNFASLIKYLTMKKITTLLTALTLVAFTSIGFSQTKEEHHKNLTAHHEKAKSHAKAIVDGTSKTKEEHVKNAEAASKSLDEAKKAHEGLKKAMPEKHKEAAKEHHANIEKHHAEATKHATALKEELKKSSPDEKKVKEHAKNLHESLDKAEKEHQALKEKTK
jgi:hypothetical protein